MLCHSCNQANPAGAIFCGACGSPLVPEQHPETCSVCNAALTPGSKFCGQCGSQRTTALACRACGHPILADSLFCGECGTPVKAPGDDTPGQLASASAPDVRLSDPTLPSSSRTLPTPVEMPLPAASIAFDGMETLRELMPVGLAAKMQQEASLISGERREVTVLFMSLSGFESSNPLLDGEEIYLLTDTAIRQLVQIVYHYEGTVDKFTSHGLMALFGAPMTHENDPERAVRAALEMEKVLAPLQERCLLTFGVDFQIRIGVNTGVVIAGNLGSNLHMEYTVIGDTVNMASRLEGAAAPGTTLISFSTYQRIRPLFDFRVLPPFRVKGKPEPIRAYQPLGLCNNPDRVRGLAGLQVPMVGRQEMLDELLQTWKVVQAEKKSQIALITGDAGLGKSRLVAEFYRLLDPGLALREGHCLAHTRSTPFWVLGSILRAMLGLVESDPATVCQNRIHQFLQDLGLHAADMTPYVLNILGVEQPSPELTARLAMMDAAMLQQQTHVVLHQLVRAEARQREIILVLEDIHWIDSASRNFLIDLLRSSGDLPIFFILVSRSYERSTVIKPIVDLLEKHPACNVDIQLQALSAEQEYSLIDQLLSQANVHIPNIHLHIARRAEGNPFYIEEIVRMLLDKTSASGLADQAETDGDVSAHPESLDAESLMHGIPGSLTGLILARFDNLGGPLRSAMQIAAVIGRSFTLGLLQHLLDSNAEKMLGVLQELIERQFLIEEPMENGVGFSFRHALIQEAVYGTLLNRTRRQIHGEVAAALNDGEFLPGDERAEALAYHFGHSEQPQKSIPHLIIAAQNATRRSAYEASIQFYRRALALFDSPPVPYIRVYAQIHIGLGSGLKLSGEFEEARQLLLQGYQYLSEQTSDFQVEIPLVLEMLRELADVCQRSGNFLAADGYLKEALALAVAVRESPLWYTLLERTAWVKFRLGELDECTRLAQEAIRYLEERPEQQPLTLASFYNTMGGVAWQQGNLSEAITYVEGSLKMYEPQGLAWGVSVACSNLGILHWTLGHWPAGTQWYERAAKIQEENGFSFEHATSLRNLGYLRLAQGDLEIARHHFEQSLALCFEQNHSYGALATHLALATWATEAGQVDDVSRQLQLARSYEDSADTESQILLHLLSAQDYSNHGQIAEGIEYAQAALQLAKDGRMQAELVEVYHTLGAIYGKADDFKKAEEYLVCARQLAEERNAPDRVAHAQMELALLYERMVHTGDETGTTLLQDALELVRTAIVHYEKLGARLKLRQARDLEEKLYFHTTVDEPWARAGDVDVVEVDDRPRISISPNTINLPGAAEPLDGEKAYVTILWLHVELSGVHDDEEAFGQMAETLATVNHIIRQNGGHIIRHSQGVIAAFGAPIVCEDGPFRSITCASSISTHLKRLSGSGSGSLQFRLGMDHGDAVAGFLDPRNRTLFVITGEPMVRAEQLAHQAPDGALWLSARSARLLERSHSFRVVTPSTAGLSEVGQVMEYVSPLSENENPNLRKHQTRLIGRDSPLETLQQRVAALRQNESGFVWLTGEAGIGKSRLLDEFLWRQNVADLWAWRGTCSSQNTQQPFSLFSSLLHDIFDFGATTSGEERRTQLQQGLSQWISNHDGVQPYLELLSGIPPLPDDAQRLANLEPEALRRQIFVAVRTLLVGMVQQRPLLLVLDDLHWLDPMSASLLVFLSQMIASMPVLFVLSQRPTEGGDGVQKELGTIRSLHEEKNWRINLEALTDQDSRVLLSELLPSGKLSMDSYRFILERSDGNPYYMEEFLRLLIEQGHLHQDGDIWSSESDTPLKTLPLPVTLEALIRSRVDSLPTQQRQLLQLAAVIGRPFALELLTYLMKPNVIDIHLKELVRRNLLVAAQGEQKWQFNHHIAQIVVYNSMLRVRLKALHFQVAEALEGEWGTAGEEHAEELAHHFSMAEESNRALRYLVIAGDRAETRYANSEALVYYRRARDILQESAGMVANELRWRVIVGLGDTYRFVGEYDLSASALEEGLAMIRLPDLDVWRKAGMYRRLGQTCMSQGKPEAAYDHFRQALVSLEEPEDRLGQIEAARTLYYLTYTHFRRGQWEKAKDTCLLCRVYAEKANDLSELAAVENLLGGIAYQQGERAQAMQHTATAMQLRERTGYTWGVASTMGNLAILAGESGDWDRAKDYFLRSLHLREELGDTEGIAIVNNNLGWLGRIKGTLEEAEYHFRESLKVAESFKMIYHAANAMLGIGHIRQIAGDMEEAQHMISGSVDRAEQVDAQDLLSEIYRVQADILLDQGSIEEAEESARWSVLLASETGSATLEAEAWRVVSECLYRQGYLRRAEEAIGLARAAQVEDAITIESGRVAIQFGRLLHALGRFDASQTEFQRADSILQRIDAQYDLDILSRARLLHPDGEAVPAS